MTHRHAANEQPEAGLLVRFRSLDALVVYQVALGLATLVILVALVAANEPFGEPWAVITLALAAVVAERGRVRLMGVEVEASTSLVPTVLAAAVFGPIAAMLVAAASFAGDFPLLLAGERRAAVVDRGLPYLRWGIYTCNRSLAGAVAGLVASLVSHGAHRSIGVIVVGTAAAAVAAELLDVGLTGLTLQLRGGQPVALLRPVVPVVLVSASLYAPVVALLAVAYLSLSPLTLPLFLAPALAAQRLFSLYQEQRQLAEKLVYANETLASANMSFAGALIATLDARDRYTAGHSAAVAVYARDIAERLGLSAEEQQLAHLAGLVHDIGKIGLPAGLLEKPGALTLDERRQMEQHSVIGQRILAKVDTYSEIAAIVRHHHERIDGSGYPDGLNGSGIPMLARIIAVADAYNAMTSDRPYRDAMPSRVARLRLAQAADSQFDTAVVAAFEAILAMASEAYRTGSSPKFVLDIPDAPSSERVLAPLLRSASTATA